MFGEVNETVGPKASLVKYSVEFNDFIELERPHRSPFEVVRQTLQIIECEKVHSPSLVCLLRILFPLCHLKV